MSQLAVRTTDGAKRFEPGETIDVVASWELDEPQERVELRLVWNTAGKGDRDLAVVQTERFDLPSLRESRPATLRLPMQPYSFSGALISLIWALELVALPSGDSTRVEITIAPGGNEVALPALAKSTA